MTMCVDMKGLCSVLASGFTLVAAAAGIRKAYNNWCELSEVHDATTSEKAEIAFDGFLQALTLVSSGVNIYSVSKEAMYRDQRQEVGKIYEQWKIKAQQTHTDGACGDEGGETLNTLLKLGSQMEQNLLAYQRANLMLSYTNAVFMTKELIEQMKNENLQPAGRTAMLCKTITGRGSVIYFSYKKSVCNEKMEISTGGPVPIVLQIFNLTDSCFDCVQVFREGFKAVDDPMKIDNKLYVRYVLPDSLQDDTLNYLQIPESLHENEFFKNHICPITQDPIARPIFTIVNKRFPQMYERAALVKFVFQGERGSFRDPSTGVQITPENIYECHALTEKFCEIFLKLITNQRQIQEGSHVNS